MTTDNQREQQEEATKNYAERSNWIRTSVTFKLFAVGFLALLLLIPAFMIQYIISDRQVRYNEAVNEVSNAWGLEQIIGGPFLTVPYNAKVKDEQGKESVVTQYAYFLPEKLSTNGTITTNERYRGIYKAVVYGSKIQVKGEFLYPNFAEWDIPEKDILWNRAFLAVNIPDMRGIQENIELTWNNQKMLFEPGIESGFYISPTIPNQYAYEYAAATTQSSNGSGISVGVPLQLNATDKTFQFTFDLNLNGSGRLSFLPLGKVTDITLNSSWENPSFDGAFLPDERTANKDGFTAHWKILHLNRSFPQQWRGDGQNLQSSVFGVRFLVPVTEYQKNERSSKYAVMFIFLTFLGFFFVEVLNKMNIHPLQYLLVGAALCIFYLLLLSLSEHIGFNASYLVSAIAIVVLITFYCAAIFKNRKLNTAICIGLIVLYSFLYSLLQLQDYALLFGSLGLFTVLASIMYYSRNIDWYNLSKREN